MLTPKRCEECGAEFMSGPRGRICPECRKKHVGESAKRRRLCDIGARARWGLPKKEAGDPPPEWIGAAAELKPEE